MSAPSADPPSSESPSTVSPGPSKVLQHEVRSAWRSARNLGLSLLGTWSVALLVRFALPRHIGPARLGELNYADAFAQGFLLFATLGVDAYTMREAAVRPKHVSDYFGGVMAVRATLAVLLITGMLGVLHVREQPVELQIAAFIFAINWFVAGGNGSLATIQQATGNTGRLAVVNVVGKVIWGVGIGIAIQFPPSLPLWVYAIPMVAGEMIRLFFMLPVVREIGLEIRFDAAATRAVLWASVPFFLSSLATNLGTLLNVAVLEYATTDLRELGWYSATMNLTALAMIFSPLIIWVLLPLASRAAARNQNEVGELVSYGLEAFLMAVLPVILIGWLGAPFWIELSFGPEYSHALSAFRIVILMIAATYAAMIMGTALIATGRSWTLSSLSVITVTAAPTLALLLIPRMGAWLGVGGQAAGAAVAITIPECMVALIGFLYIGKSARTARLGRKVGLALAACAIVVIADRAMLSLGYLRLVLDAALYTLLVLGTKTIDLREVRSVIDVVRAARGQGAQSDGSLQ